MTEATPVHWDDEIIGFDMHPTTVSGVGAVRTQQGTDAEGTSVKFVEVWDGAQGSGEPIGSAGIRPTNVTHASVMPHARWVLEFTLSSVRLQAVPVAPPAPWEDED